jgi:heptosyltransferase-1
MHPGVHDILPVGLRGLRRDLFDRARWSSLAGARRALAHGGWDYVIDSQGLIKSALVARLARGVTFGLDRTSARERLAARFYDVKMRVGWDRHAVERNRELVSQVFGYRIVEPARYGLAAPIAPPAWAPKHRYAVLLHAASHAEKRWSEKSWVALGGMLADAGYACVLPGGTEAERAVAARLAAAIPNAVAAPAAGLPEIAALLAHAERVAGVDTGLTHLAVAFDRPTAGIFCATQPQATGLHGTSGVNLGGPGKPPSVEAVAAALGCGPEARETVAVDA